MAYAQIDTDGIVFAIVDSSKPIPGGVHVDYDPSILGKKWNGSTFDDVPRPVAVPSSLTPRQFRLAAFQLGLLDEIEAAVAAADRVTQINYGSAIEFRRDDPILCSMAAALGKTGAEIDALFSLGVNFI